MKKGFAINNQNWRYFLKMKKKKKKLRVYWKIKILLRVFFCSKLSKYRSFRRVCDYTVFVFFNIFMHIFGDVKLWTHWVLNYFYIRSLNKYREIMFGFCMFVSEFFIQSFKTKLAKSLHAIIVDDFNSFDFT